MFRTFSKHFFILFFLPGFFVFCFSAQEKERNAEKKHEEKRKTTTTGKRKVFVLLNIRKHHVINQLESIRIHNFSFKSIFSFCILSFFFWFRYFLSNFIFKKKCVFFPCKTFCIIQVYLCSVSMFLFLICPKNINDFSCSVPISFVSSVPACVSHLRHLQLHFIHRNLKANIF